MNALELADRIDCDPECGNEVEFMERVSAMLRAQHAALEAAAALVRECRNPVPDPVFRKHLADRAFEALATFRAQHASMEGR